MNPDNPKSPRDEMEVRLTALLFGELSDQEAATLRRAIEANAELASLYERLKQTIDLVRETATSPAEQTAAQPAPLRLSEERRQKLLAHFKTVASKEFIQPRRRETHWTVPMSIAAVLVAMIGATLLLPLSFRARETAQLTAIENNRRIIEGARDQWALENKKSTGDGATLADLADYLKGGSVKSVAGETYNINAIGQPATVTLPGRFASSSNLEDSKRSGERLPAVQTIAPARLVDEALVAHAELRGFYDDEKKFLAPAGPATEEKRVAAKPLVRSKGGLPRVEVAQDRSGGQPTTPASERQPSIEGAEARNFAAIRRQEIVLPSVGETVEAAAEQLETRTFRVDPRAIEQALESAGVPIGNLASAGKAGAGGIGGGGFGGAQVKGGVFDVPRVHIAGDGLDRRGDAMARGEPSPLPVQPSADPKTASAAVPPQVNIETRQAGTAPSFAGATPAAWPVLTRPVPEGAVALKEPEFIGALERNGDATSGIKADNVPALRDVAALGTQLQPETITAGVPLDANRLMMQRYGLIPRGATPTAGGETAAGAPIEYGLAPTAGPQTTGKDLSKWGAVDSGVVVTNGIVPGPEQPPGQKMPKDVALAWDLNRNERFDQTSLRGREAQEIDSLRESEVVFGDTTVRPSGPNTIAARESLRRKSSSVVLPEGTNISPTAGVNQALSLYAELEDRTLLRSENLPPAKVPLQENLSKQEAVRKLASGLASNGITMIPIGDKFVKAVPSSEALQEGRALNEKDRLAEADAKRELDNLQKVRDAVQLRIMQEKVDATIPKTSKVEIVDAAEAQPEQKPTLWQRIRGGDVERTARIAVEREATNFSPLGLAQSSTQYDPGFIQSEFEKIESKNVLNKVIEKLNLNEAWTYKHATGGKLQTEDTYKLLKDRIDVRQDPKSKLIDITAKSDNAEEAARIANTVAEVYRDTRLEQRKQMAVAGVKALEQELVEHDKKIASTREELQRLERESKVHQVDEDRPVAPRKPDPNALIPQPEIQTRDNPWSTFSLNVSDVSFKLAAASLEKGALPEPASVRSEEFINAFDYRDPEPPPGVPIAFAWERARYPFAHNRDLLRFSVKTAAAGRQHGRPLNLVLLLDNSGSMERADRVHIIHEALRVLAAQLQPQDRISVITFARTPRLWADGVPGNQAGEIAEQVGGLTPQGGTNLEEAMNLAYQTALRHYLAGGVNRVVLLTDGAANLGNVDPEALKRKVEAHRKQGVALDCFGVGWEGFNDDLLEVLSRNGDGRYGFINSPEEAATEFVAQLAGALHVAASDVKVQIEFNSRRVTAYRQIGYAKHQLTKEQFRDNTVDAAEIGAAESGNALYVAEVNPRGEGPLAIVRVRFKVPGTADYREHEWAVPFTGNAVALEQASPAMRLAATASAFSEWLVSSPYAAEVTYDQLLGYLGGAPEIYGADARPKKLEWMIRQAKSIAGE